MVFPARTMAYHRHHNNVVVWSGVTQHLPSNIKPGRDQDRAQGIECPGRPLNMGSFTLAGIFDAERSHGDAGLESVEGTPWLKWSIMGAIRELDNK